jgi:hypothetical protein
MTKIPALVCSRWISAGLMILMALLAIGSAPSARAAKAIYGKVDRIEVYSTDTEAETKAFLSQLLEVRRQVAELVAPAPLPTPRLQVVIFNRLRDYHEFLPPQGNREMTVGGYAKMEYGCAAVAVREGGQGYDFGRKVILANYAHDLLATAMPEMPYWIRAGLTDFFGGTEYRSNRLYVGGSFMKHREEVARVRFLPLNQLMDDAAVAQYVQAPFHDNVLYRQSWTLWQQWLANPDQDRRAQVNRLFTAIRGGAKGDFATVVEAFGETGQAIEAAHRGTKSGLLFPPLQVNADAASLVRDLVLRPATELDLRVAQALVSAGNGNLQRNVPYELLRLAEANPSSPRPAESLGILALASDDGEAAKVHWEKARELGTDNPFAYMEAVRRALNSRNVRLVVQPQIPETLAAKWREWLDRSAEFNPGSIETDRYRVIVEAMAPAPDRAMLEAIEARGTLANDARSQTYVALAYWRLGDHAKARELLASMASQSTTSESERYYAELLAGAFNEDERRRAGASE